MVGLPEQCQAENTAQNTTDKKSGSGRHKKGEIKITYLNELQPGLLEKALIDIYAKKIKNGTLRIDSDDEEVMTAI